MGAGAGFASGWRSREAERALMQINAAPGLRTTLAIVGCAPIPPTSQPRWQMMKPKKYSEELRRLQTGLCKLQEWVKYKGLRIVVIFEGRDTAGKGGTIRALTERVSPRVFRVAALPAPSDREKSQMYLQRYVAHLPAAGEIVIFDRSWYNRAGIEHVMGFCSKEQYRSFLALCPLFEHAVVGNGIQLIKF